MLCYLLLLESDRDKDAFARLYHDQRGKLLSAARRFFPTDRTRAEDAVHQAFLNVAKHFTNFLQIPCHERQAYLVTIVKNACRDILRKEKKYAEWSEESDAGRGLDSNTEGLDESYRRAVELIYALPDKYRATLELRLILGLNNKEAAKRMGAEENTVAQWYARGRKMVAEQLEKEGLGLG